MVDGSTVINPPPEMPDYLHGSGGVEIFHFGEHYVVLTLPAIPHYPPLASIGEH